jgi:hypothetical protein
MDTLLLSSTRRRLGSAANQEAFNKAFGLPSLDGYGNCIGSIDMLNKGERSFLNPYDLLSDILRVRTKGIDDDFELIAAVAAAVLSRKLNPSRDAFNFFLSQLRIRIEQAFGMLVMKWRIFKRPLEVKFWRTTIIIEAAFRLHNFASIIMNVQI